MIEVRLLRQEPDAVRAAVARRLDPTLDREVDRALELDRRRREVLTRTESLKAERNSATGEVAVRIVLHAGETDTRARRALAGLDVTAAPAGPMGAWRLQAGVPAAIDLGPGPVGTERTSTPHVDGRED